MLFLGYFITARTARWLFKYVFNAGNILATLFALTLPYLARFNFLPYLYHPYRYGGIPFAPPSFFEYQSMYYIFIISSLIILYIVSGFMAVYKICNQGPIDSYQIVLYNITKFLMILMLCLFVLFFVPLLKFPLLTGLIILPYANELVNGLFWSIFTL